MEKENRSGDREENKQSLSALTKEKPTQSNAISIPEISLPKGGGAIKGIDEQFKVNAANGTAAFSLPLPLTPGRNEFTPSLSLNYNSGSGNGPFGLGWSLGMPSIRRKTDKHIPAYGRTGDEDEFMFSEGGDLVPYLEEDDEGEWGEKEYPDHDDYNVRRYRPRIEGDFSRVERIEHSELGIYWKVTSRDNIVTIFGRTADTRIADPEDDRRIFEWFPEFSYDNKGNWIRYEFNGLATF
ncbi:MAG: hypothetical protein FH748_14075 [Balneolaceae bacterium]|nr:hypothetical protein [Balneolaceae bacterium]